MWVIHNTSKGMFKKLFGKDHLENIELTNTGFGLNFIKAGRIELAFEDIREIRTHAYFGQTEPYRTAILITNDNKEYSIDLDPHNGDIQRLLKHYSIFQLGSTELPEDVNELNLLLEYIKEDSYTKLENGNLVVVKKGAKTIYSLSEVRHYKIDAGAGWLGFKFPDKTLYVTIGINSANNIWLIHTILQTYFDKAGLFN